MDPSSVMTQVSKTGSPGSTTGPPPNDPASIITQVKQDIPPKEDGEDVLQDNNGQNHESDNHINIEQEKNNKKERSSFLCCFGGGRCCRAKSKTPDDILVNQNNKDREKQIKKEAGPTYKKSSIFSSYLCCFGGFKKSKPKTPLSEGGSLLEATPYPPDEKSLLPELLSQDFQKKCLVIDLDETLVHSSFKPISNADFIVPVEIDGTIHQVYVLKRPHVDEFLKHMGDLYECVLFTASLAKYADPVTDLLDKWGVFRARLFREACVFHRGNYVKDLRRLGREVSQVIIIDNSPASYVFHPDNAVPVQSWFDDMSDRELLDLIPFLENLSKVDNVYAALQNVQKTGSLTNNAQLTQPPGGSSPPTNNPTQ